MILVCGETLIDLVHVDGEMWRALPGGSPANTAVALARLSTSTAMLARISSDAFGTRLRDRLVGDGVDVRYVVTAAEQSSMAVVDLGEDGSARYSFYLRETADWQWVTNDLPVAFDPSVTALHAGSMALMMPPGGVVLEAMLERERAQRVVSIDPNVRASICPDPRVYREIVERWLRLAHIVKASVDDVNWLYPDRTVADVLADWSTRGPSLVVFTRSADGALARLPSGLEVGVRRRSTSRSSTPSAPATPLRPACCTLSTRRGCSTSRRLASSPRSRSKKRCGSPSWCQPSLAPAPDPTRPT